MAELGPWPAERPEAPVAVAELVPWLVARALQHRSGEKPRFGLEPFADDARALLAIGRPRYSVVRLHYRNVLGRYQP